MTNYLVEKKEKKRVGNTRFGEHDLSGSFVESRRTVDTQHQGGLGAHSDDFGSVPFAISYRAWSYGRLIFFTLVEFPLSSSSR